MIGWWTSCAVVAVGIYTWIAGQVASSTSLNTWNIIISNYTPTSKRTIHRPEISCVAACATWTIIASVAGVVAGLTSCYPCIEVSIATDTAGTWSSPSSGTISANIYAWTGRTWVVATATGLVYTIIKIASNTTTKSWPWVYLSMQSGIACWASRTRLTGHAGILTGKARYSYIQVLCEINVKTRFLVISINTHTGVVAANCWAMISF